MNDSLKILILEDSESDAELITRVLIKSGITFNSLRVESEESFIKALEEYAPDVILSDHSLPGFDSQEAYKIYKHKNLNMPFILVTGTVSEEFAVECLHKGIDDYILKDNLTRLPSSIEHALKNRELEFKKKELELSQKVYAEKLEEQNKELIKINKELDRFVYSTSHELKAPLNTILGLINLTHLELAKKEYDGFDAYIKLMETCVEKLGNTVENIMSYSINNRTVIQKTPIDIEKLIESIWKKLSDINEIHIIEKKIEIIQTAVWYSDEDRLKTIFENLISNSIKYYNKEQKSPFVLFKIRISEDKVLIKIEDNGVGIPAKYIGRIFDMFYRVSTLSDGSGLGLYIVKETLEKLDGKITVFSEANQGTIFNIELPNFSTNS
jgi:signal transduction histidine kinase